MRTRFETDMVDVDVDGQRNNVNLILSKSDHLSYSPAHPASRHRLHSLSTPPPQNVLHHLTARGLGQFLRVHVIPDEPHPHRHILQRPASAQSKPQNNDTYLRVQVIPDNLTNLLFGHCLARLEYHPCSNDLAVLCVWDCHRCRLSYRRMCCQNVLYLNGEQILVETQAMGP